MSYSSKPKHTPEHGAVSNEPKMRFYLAESDETDSGWTILQWLDGELYQGRLVPLEQTIAAPDLLEALEDLISVNHTDLGGDFIRPCSCNAHLNARAAIAKAKGEVRP